MEPQKLIKMANEIGAFFEAEPDPDRALAGVADHLRRFWDPRMRRELLGWLEQHGDEALRPLVRAAIAAHRERLQPTEG